MLGRALKPRLTCEAPLRACLAVADAAILGRLREVHHPAQLQAPVPLHLEGVTMDAHTHLVLHEQWFSVLWMSRSMAVARPSILQDSFPLLHTKGCPCTDDLHTEASTMRGSP